MTSLRSGENTATTAQRIGWAILILATLSICYFSHLGVIGFVGPDEPRYAWIARDMAESGDWITPRLYGKPWFEKPPLLYWGGALFFKLLGEGHPEVAARLPSAISALLATLGLAWLAGRTYGEECARWLLLLLPTSVGMIAFSHAAATDMPFAGMLTIAMVCAAVVVRVVHHQNDTAPARTPWITLILFGFFLGLAVLAKGPAGIILCAGAVFFWAIFTKRWRDALRLFHPAAIATFCVTALPWYVLCARRNPDFFRIFIIEHNFKRFLTPEFRHIQPPWYYAIVLLIAFLPWSGLLLSAIGVATPRVWRTRQLNSTTCFALCWAGFCLIFFTISKSKLPGYVLPAIPAIGILLAKIISSRDWFPRKLAAYSLLASGLLFLVPVVVLRISPNLAKTRLHLPAAIPYLFFTVLALATCSLGISFLAKLHSKASFGSCTLGILAVVFLVVDTGAIVKSNNLGVMSGKWLAEDVKHYVPSVENLRTIGYRRDYRYALNFYLRREIPEWSEAPIHDGYVLSNHLGCDQLKTTDNCLDLWGYMDFVPGGALLKVTPRDLLPGPGGGGQSQQKE
jgi:4-amino-4-deoxy-L-arabinose transferase-like glycosyltransferase